MRALVMHALNGPDGLRVEDVEEPSHDPGQVLIQVEYAGMAFPDLLITRGLYQVTPDLPFTPGLEVAGHVLSAPAGSDLATGQAVVAYPSQGGYAERVVAPADRVFALPSGIASATAAAMPINYLTMDFALDVRVRLAADEWVVVHGAGGGLGLAAIQVARAGGARVIAVASSEEKRRAAQDAGAHAAIPVEGFLDAVRELTEGGADIVVDPVGGDRVTDSLRCLRPCGRLLILGFTAGEIPSVKVNRLLLNNLDVVGVGWGAFAERRPGYMRERWDLLIARLSEAGITPVAPDVVDLAEIPGALAAMESRSLTGKVVARLQT